MRDHWRLAVRYAIWVVAGATIVGTFVQLRYGPAYAGSFGYGVVVGLASFLSTALTVSLLTSRSGALRVVGAASFVGRYGFVAVALGMPAYLGSWPAVAMLAGFAGVYLAENAVLVPGVVRIAGTAGRAKTGSAGEELEKAERRVAA